MKLLTLILTRRMIYCAIALIASALTLAACSSTTSTTVSTPPLVIGKAVTGDTLRGSLNGTVTNVYPAGTAKAGQPHTTWYMDSNVVIPAGDTLLVQPGITIIVLNTGVANAIGTPEFQVFGTFICAGESGKPIYLTVPQNLRNYKALTDVTSGSLWGGVECDLASGDLILKWTHIEYAGGTGGANDPIVKGGTRYAVWFQNPLAHFIMEDSWITGSTDDPLRVSSGKISIFRNVVECASPNTGDFNMKSGTVGDIAYNLYVGIATNGPKLANTGTATPECNVNIYNNTVVTCGWRVTKSGRAGSIDIESSARGTVFNNLIVNCRTGFRILGGSTVADTADTFYGYQWYYGNADTVVSLFYPPDGIQVAKTTDKAGKAGDNDPKFMSYDVANAVPASLFATFPIAFSNQKPVENIMRTMDENGNQRFVDLAGTTFRSDFRLQPNSPCIGKAFTGTVKDVTGAALPIPMNACPLKSSSNPYGATTKGLGADFGAYQSDNTGNQQY